MTGRWLTAAAVLAAAVVAAGCGGSDEPGALQVVDAWARATPDVATNGAIYLRIENGTETDETLVGATVPEEIAAGLMLHRTTVTGGSHDAMDESAMEEMSRLELPAGGSATLEPGGDHLMLMGLKAPLETGEVFDLQLVLASGDRVSTEVEVRDP